MLNFFDFEGKDSMKEDDTTDTVYCSEQPLLGCGFIPGSTKAYAITPLSIEIIDLETAEVFTKILKFPHDSTYIIGMECLNNQMYVNCGNNKGEVYQYLIHTDKK